MEVGKAVDYTLDQSSPWASTAAIVLVPLVCALGLLTGWLLWVRYPPPLPAIVTLAEYEAVRSGATLAEACRIIGSEPTDIVQSLDIPDDAAFMPGFQSEGVAWQNADESLMVAAFHNGRLVLKSQRGLR